MVNRELDDSYGASSAEVYNLSMPWHHLAECAVAAQARFRNVEAALEVVSLRLPSSLETSPADSV